LNIKGYTHINWSKEEKEEFWDALDKYLRTLVPQKSFDFFIDKSPIEPEVKPVIKDKKGVVKQSQGLANVAQIISRNIGLKAIHFIGYVNERGKDEAKWQDKGFSAFVPIEKLSSLNPKEKINEGQLPLIPTSPNTTVSQIKSIYTLNHMLQIENEKREKAGQDKTGKLDFSLKEYAKMRGKSDAQIARGGGVLDELKRDLITGHVTDYIIDEETTTGQKRYFFNYLYGIAIPKPKSKEKWGVIFNEPYLTDILNSKQYFLIPLDVIQDTNTDKKKGYLFYFYTVVMSYANTKTNFKTQLKVSTLLENIRVGDRTKDIPKIAFNVLCECIYYTATNYEGTIKEVRFFNNGKREKEKLITDLEKFKEWDYNEFKNEVLNGLGLTDIREALISFNHTTPRKELTEAKREEPDEQIGQYKTTL